jgi:hypothetical protein
MRGLWIFLQGRAGRRQERREGSGDRESKGQAIGDTEAGRCPQHLQLLQTHNTPPMQPASSPHIHSHYPPIHLTPTPSIFLPPRLHQAHFPPPPQNNAPAQYVRAPPRPSQT